MPDIDQLLATIAEGIRMMDEAAHRLNIQQATIEALFRRFDPVAIEADHPQLSMGEKVSKTIHHARLWGVYLAQYRQIRDEVKDSFFKRLGAEFQDAYNKEYGRDRGEDV